MKPSLPNSEQEIVEHPISEEVIAAEFGEKAAREKAAARLRLLWDQRRFLLQAVLYGLLTSILIAFLIPKRYESTTRIMPPDTQPTSGLAMLAALSSRAGALSPIAGDVLGLKSSSALFVGILRSRTVEDRLIHQFDLKKVYWERHIENARDELESNTQVSEDRKSGVITLTVRDRNPQVAQAMAQAYVHELDRLVAQVSTSAARREREFLEKRLQVVKQDLDKASVDFSQFASKNTAIDIKEQGKAMVEAAAALQGHLIAAQTELEGLKQIYTENNVRVRAARARIVELQHQLEKLGGKDATLTPSSSREGEPLYPSIRKLPLLGVTYSDLYRRTRIAEVVYELLTQQYELAKVQEAKEIPTVKVLDLPVIPEKKSFPSRPLIVVSGTLLSLACGLVWVYGMAFWRETDPQDSRKVLAQEILAALRARSLWFSQNGNQLRAVTSKVWRHWSRRQNRSKLENKES